MVKQHQTILIRKLIVDQLYIHSVRFITVQNKSYCMETVNEDTTSFTGCCLTSWAGGAYRAGAGLLLQEITEEGGRILMLNS